jgi:5-methylcytosine-specific restriction endonuclease McrA
MPIDYNDYPDNWKTEIRPRILERAGHKCERCGVPNYAYILRNDDNPAEYIIYNVEEDYHYLDDMPVRLSELPSEYADSKYVKIILTIAHIYDHDPMNCADDNLQALCQRCHLIHDAPLHAQRAAVTRRKKHEQRTGQLSMFPELE